MTEPTPPPLGSLAEETARLLAALRGGDPGPNPPAPTADSPHPPTCTWCPLCRGVESLRSVDPAAVERVADAMMLLAQAVGELATHLRERRPSGEPGAGTDRAPGARTDRAPGGAASRGAPAAYDIPVGDGDQESR